MVLPKLKKPAVTPDGYCKLKLIEKQAEELQRPVKEVEEEMKRKRKDSKVHKRAKWYKMWEAMAIVSMAIDDMFCPECRQPASTHLVFKGPQKTCLKKWTKWLNKK